MQKPSKFNLIFIALMCCFGTEALCINEDSSDTNQEQNIMVQENYEELENLFNSAASGILQGSHYQEAFDIFNNMCKQPFFTKWLNKDNNNFLKFYLFRAETLYALKKQQEAEKDINEVFNTKKYKLYRQEVTDKTAPPPKIDPKKDPLLNSVEDVLNVFENNIQNGVQYEYIIHATWKKTPSHKAANSLEIPEETLTDNTLNNPKKTSSIVWIGRGAAVLGGVAALSWLINHYYHHHDTISAAPNPTADEQHPAIEQKPVIARTEGTQQSTRVNTAFKKNLKVVVTQSGNPVSNVQVKFKAPTIEGASGTFEGNHTNETIVVTGVNGEAEAPIFTANDIAGHYIVIVTIVDADGAIVETARFNLTNIEDEEDIARRRTLTVVPTGGKRQIGGPTKLFPNDQVRIMTLADAHKDGIGSIPPTFIDNLKKHQQKKSGTYSYYGAYSAILPEQIYKLLNILPNTYAMPQISILNSGIDSSFSL